MSAQTEQQNPNIYQRLNAVRDAVKYLQKDADVQGYKALTHDAVTAACRKHFIDNGVMVVPTQKRSNIVDVGTTKSGTPVIRYEAEYDVRFINIDNPDDMVTVTLESHANDHGDKAPGKALSYAVKYAMLKLLSIETGESEEGRIEYLTPQQRMKEVLEDERVADAVHRIKKGIEDGNYEMAAKAWFGDLEDEEKMALWVAPSKGGIFTTAERAAIKETAFREAYYGKKKEEDAA